MSTHLSLKASKKIFELVGDYETAKSWHYRLKSHIVKEVKTKDGCELFGRGEIESWIDDWEDLSNEPELHIKQLPAPSFSELVRVMPKIGEKKMLSHGGWRIKATTSMIVGRMVRLYMYADTEPEGMAAVEKYLDEILK